MLISLKHTFINCTSTLNNESVLYFPHFCFCSCKGRFFVSSAFVLAANVYGKKKPDPETTDGKEKFIYVIRDGHYGSFPEHVRAPLPKVIRIKVNGCIMSQDFNCACSCFCMSNGVCNTCVNFEKLIHCSDVKENENEEEEMV